MVRALAVAGITNMAAANQYLERHYLPAYNVEFGQPAVEVGSTFIPCLGANFKAIRCEHFWRQVRPDNCGSFEALILQIPRHRHRCHFVKATVSVRRYRADTTRSSGYCGKQRR